MIEEYRSEVLRFYQEKKAAGMLSMNLMYPTPANLRNEFRLLLNEGCDKTDQRMLKEFFAMPLQTVLSEVPQRKYDPEKFKALCNFLLKGTNSRERNIELLAWLVDFRPRPFSNYWRTVSGKSEPLSELAITEKGIVEEHQYQRGQSLKALKQWSATEQLAPQEVTLLDYGQDLQKKLTLEYPSGVKVCVDASDLSLIAQLVKM